MMTTTYVKTADQRPRILILTPTSGKRLLWSEVLKLNAVAVSAPPYPLIDGSQLVWVSNIDDKLGKGPYVENIIFLGNHRVNNFSIGNHVITVTGYGTKAEVSIHTFSNLWELYCPSQQEISRIMNDLM